MPALRKQRAEDAFNAARAALEEGIVAGGGAAYVHAAAALADLRGHSDDMQKGIDLVINALAAPMRQIGRNAGVEGDVLAQRVHSLPVNEGYNAMDASYGDMFAAGIIDSLKVLRVALESAASITRMALLTECMLGG